MNVHIDILNRSAITRTHRRDVLARLAQRVCEGEGLGTDAELSVLFCDDPCIRDLNRTYRGKDQPTDVLSFAQAPAPGGGPLVLGDIVISLETVVRNTGGDPASVRKEVLLLFCHGLLHLLGYVHDTAARQTTMQTRQAHYLGWSHDAAWRTVPDDTKSRKSGRAR